jgi:hypothetical protein
MLPSSLPAEKLVEKGLMHFSGHFRTIWRWMYALAGLVWPYRCDRRVQGPSICRFARAGFGDLLLRAKINLLGNDSGPIGFALNPYVKLPSSTPVISNGAVEGGLIAPLALRPDDFILTLMTEFDVLKNADGVGSFANFVNLVGVSHPIPGLAGVKCHGRAVFIRGDRCVDAASLYV